MNLLTGIHEDRDGVPCADLLVRVPGATAAAAAEQLLTELPGWLAATSDSELADALLSRGATVQRHADQMRLDLARTATTGEAPTTRPPFAVRAFGDDASPPAPWTDALAGFLAAYPPEHPDYLPGGVELIETYLIPYTAGARLGPLITSASGFAMLGDRVAGGILVVDRAGEGPWISDIWRDPDPACAGAGRALLEWSAQRLGEAGFARLGLAVTHTNERARRRYLASGFVTEMTSWTFRLPGSAGAPGM